MKFFLAMEKMGPIKDFAVAIVLDDGVLSAR